MTYAEYNTYAGSLTKLKQTSRLPFEDAKVLFPFLVDLHTKSMPMTEHYKNSEMIYARLGNKNFADREAQIMAKKSGEPTPEAEISPTEMLSNDGLTVDQLQRQHKERNDILDTEITGIKIPWICIRVVKMLYETSQKRREDEYKADQEQKKKDDPTAEPYFTAEDVGAYLHLGLTKPEEKPPE